MGQNALFLFIIRLYGPNEMVLMKESCKDGHLACSSSWLECADVNQSYSQYILFAELSFLAWFSHP